MAIYRTGTASLAANGVVIGVGTKWQDKLSLIRVGATIMFPTVVGAIGTISAIVSDTELRVMTTNGAVVPAGSQYVILLHDSITVDGLAQDVAETLRYYQGKETEIAEALDFFKTFDWEYFKDAAEKVTADAAAAEASKVAAAGSATAAAGSATEAKTSETNAKAYETAANSSKQSAAASQVAAKTSETKAKTSETNAKNSENAALTSKNAAAGSATAALASQNAAKTSETNSKTSETAAKTSETNAKTSEAAALASKDAASGSQTEAANSAAAALASQNAAKSSEDKAKGYADSINPSQLLAKSQNLADLESKEEAMVNLRIDRFSQSETNGETQMKTKAKDKWIFVKENGDWGGWDNANNKSMPLPIDFGGTGRGDSVAEFSQFKSNGESLDGIILKQNGTGFGGAGWADSSDKVRWRMGIDSAAGDFKWFSYDAAGAYRDTMLEITGSGLGSMVFFRDITVRPTTEVPSRSLVLNNGKSSVPAGSFRTMWDTVNINSNQIYKYFEKGDGSGITVNWPSSGGVLALQGTSGRDFKKDITDANVSEAVARVEQMRMVHYVYKDDVQERVRFGIIAEEAEEIAPQYIKHREETYDVEVDPDTNAIVGGKIRDRPSIDVNPIVMDLMGCAQFAIAECKRLAAEVDELKSEIAELRSK